MKTGILPAVGLVLAAAPNAHALINLELSSNDLTVVAPSSGTTQYQLDGSVILTDGWKNATSSAFAPYLADMSANLPVTWDSSYLMWLSGPESSNYSGAILDLTVSSATPSGTYFAALGSPTGLAEIDAVGIDPTGLYHMTDTETYEVHVDAAPEPSGFLMLGWTGAMVLLRRRTRTS